MRARCANFERLQCKEPPSPPLAMFPPSTAHNVGERDRLDGAAGQAE